MICQKCGKSMKPMIGRKTGDLFYRCPVCWKTAGRVVWKRVVRREYVMIEFRFKSEKATVAKKDKMRCVFCY